MYSMLEIKNVLDKFYEVKRPRSERAVIVKMFLDRLLAERGDDRFYVKDKKRIPLKPINPKMVAVRLRYISTSDLYYVYSICKDATSFSKMFWFMTRTKVLA